LIYLLPSPLQGIDSEETMILEHVSPQRRRRYRRDEASAYLLNRHDIRCGPGTLAKLAVLGGGPAMQYVGRWPLYAEDALDEWALSKSSPPVRSTSEMRALKLGTAKE
jgi:hypothetical protein